MSVSVLAPSTLPVPQAATRLFGATFMWLAILFALSYKLKVLGFPAVRPLYLQGVALMIVYIGYLVYRVANTRVLTLGSRNELALVALLLITCAYLIAQGFVYAESRNATIYCVFTVVVVYLASWLAAVRHGATRFLHVFTYALVAYSAVNFVYLGLGKLIPEIFGILQLAEDENSFGTRLSGFPGDPTHLGALMALALMMLWVVRPPFPRWLMYSFVGLALAAIGMSGSRNAVLSLGLGWLASLFINGGASKSVWKALAAATTMAILIAAVLIFSEEAMEYVVGTFRLDDPNRYGRTEVWRDMAEIYSGLTGFEVLFGGGYQFIQGLYGSPYNAFLRILFDHGVIGLLATLGAVLLVFSLILLHTDALVRRAAISLLVFWGVFSMFLDTFFAEFFHLAELGFWVPAALVTAGVWTTPRGAR
jgi:hypothetical protein